MGNMIKNLSRDPALCADIAGALYDAVSHYELGYKEEQPEFEDLEQGESEPYVALAALAQEVMLTVGSKSSEVLDEGQMEFLAGLVNTQFRSPTSKLYVVLDGSESYSFICKEIEHQENFEVGDRDRYTECDELHTAGDRLIFDFSGKAEKMLYNLVTSWKSETSFYGDVVKEITAALAWSSNKREKG